MISILYFFHLAKFFGLTPFMLQVDGKNHKPSLRFLVRIPTFLMIFFYSICICSIFWKNKAVSEISNTANWIQVSINPFDFDDWENYWKKFFHFHSSYQIQQFSSLFLLRLIALVTQFSRLAFWFRSWIKSCKPCRFHMERRIIGLRGSPFSLFSVNINGELLCVKVWNSFILFKIFLIFYIFNFLYFF